MGFPNRIREDNFDFYKDGREFYFLKIHPGAAFSIDNVETIRAYIEENHSSSVLPFLIELGYGTTISESVQAYLAEAESRYSSADAILISTFAHKVLANFYMRHFKPGKTTKVFSDVFDALDWIESKRKVVS